MPAPCPHSQRLNGHAKFANISSRKRHNLQNRFCLFRRGYEDIDDQIKWGRKSCDTDPLNKGAESQDFALIFQYLDT